MGRVVTAGLLRILRCTDGDEHRCHVRKLRDTADPLWLAICDRCGLLLNGVHENHPAALRAANEHWREHNVLVLPEVFQGPQWLGAEPREPWWRRWFL